MKTLVVTLFTLVIVGLGWVSLGWIAFIVLPFTALAALLTFSPLIVEWEKQQAAQERVAPNRKEAVVATRPAGARC